MKHDKEKVEVLSTDISDDEISLKYEVLSANLVDNNDRLTTGISQLTGGITDVLVNGESVVEGSTAYVNVTTTKYVDEKVATEKEERVAEDTAIRNEMSILHQETQQQLSILNTKIDNGLSTLNNKINEVDLRLSDTKLDKNLSVLPDANPNLSIESKENLLVYLYNTKDNMASKAKLTELGY